MPIRNNIDSGRRFVEADLQISPLQLDLTSPRSALRDGQASVIVGRDVINGGRLAKAPRRRPVGITYPAGMADDLDISRGGHPLTTAIPCNMRGNVVKRQGYSSGAAGTPGSYTWEYVQMQNAGGLLVLTDAGRIKYVDWPEGAKASLAAGRSVSVVFDDHLPPVGSVNPKPVRAFGTVNGVGEPQAPAVFIGSPEIPPFGVGSFALDEAWATPLVDDNTAGGFFDDSASAGFNFSIVWQEYFDKRGIWVSNGRKFWLLQRGVYTEYLDLGESAGALGVEWRGAQISPNVFMFVHPKLPPRIIPLEAEPRTGPVNEVDATKYLGGVLAPELGQRDYPPAQFYAIVPGSTVLANASLSSGGATKRIDAGSGGVDAQYRLRLRVIDERTGAVSRFVDASALGFTLRSADQVVQISSANTNMVLYVAAHLAAYGPTVGNGFILDHYTGEGQFRIPFKTARGTHVEFWRTTKGGINFFRELRKGLAFGASRFFDRTRAFRPNDKYTDPTFSTKLTEVSGFTQSGDHAVLNLPDFELQRKQLMGGVDERLGGLPPMCLDVINVLGCTLAGGANDEESVLLIQGKRLTWPRIAHDGQIRYSEVSGGFLYIYPESFHPFDFRTLTRDQDKFQRFVASSDVVIAVYAKGAYRLVRESTAISHKQLGQSGIGTPWPNAILPVGKLALWVTPTAIRVYNAEAENGIGDLVAIEHGPMLQWFTDAMNAGMQIDAGYDERYGTLHLRRNKVVTVAGNVAGGGGVASENDALLSGVLAVTDNADVPNITALSDEDDGGVAAPELLGAKVAYYLDSAAVFNLKTGDWTLIEDDSGFRYVAAENIVEEEDAPGSKLYSVDQFGGVLEENHFGTSHPYDFWVVQDVLTAARWTFTDRRIATQSGARFTIQMRGDVVRFRSSNPVIDGLARTIRVADPGKIEFDPLPASLQEGDEFLIGAVRFRVRFAPIVGESLRTVKSIAQLAVYARPGPLHNGISPWGNRPAHPLTVRAYREFGDTPRPSEDTAVEVFDDDDVDRKTEHRYSDIHAQGQAIEIEIEDHNVRSDMVIDGVFAKLEEEGDLVADASGAA